MRFHRKNRFKFTEKTQSRKGIAALVLAAVLLILYGIMVFLAYRSNGTLSPYYGSVGILAICFVIANMVLSIQSTMEENSFQLIPHMALILTVIAAICWIGTLIIGLIN